MRKRPRQFLPPAFAANAVAAATDTATHYDPPLNAHDQYLFHYPSPPFSVTVHGMKDADLVLLVAKQSTSYVYVPWMPQMSILILNNENNGQLLVTAGSVSRKESH